MFKTTLKALIGSTAIFSAVVVFSADADAGKRRASGFSAGPEKMKTVKTGSRRITIKKGFTATSGQPAKAAGTSSNWHTDWMVGVCNQAGGGASTGRDGQSHCTDPDGNEVLDPAPVPKPD